MIIVIETLDPNHPIFKQKLINFKNKDIIFNLIFPCGKTFK